MRIVIIGTGNTASVLGRAFIGGGHTILQVVGRSEASAATLGAKVNAPFTVGGRDVNTEADLYLIAVPDQEIENVAEWLRVDKKLVAHAAASVDMQVLLPCSKNVGVLYPLQTLRKELDYVPEIPFLVEGNTKDNGALLFDIACTMSSKVNFANSGQRLMIHVAAIFVNNFTNHLYELAETFCTNEEMDFRLLLPLIEETVSRLEHHSPAEMQTGPAIRGDVSTIKKHVDLLKSYPVHQRIYEVFSESILTLPRK